MSHPTPHTITTEEDGLPQLKPRPRRPFELGSSTPSSAANSSPSTPSVPDAPDFPPNGLQPLKTNGMADGTAPKDGNSTPNRTRSFLNLTASTLFGIYQPSGFETESQQPTPWGTGAQTPADSRHPSFDWSRANLPADAFEKGTDGRMRRRSTAPQLHRRPTAKKGFKGYYLPLVGRILALFGVGVLYGLLISHLHDRQQLAPVQVNLDRGHWLYLATWGLIGVALGEALPWVDMLWADDEDAVAEEPEEKEAKRKTKRGAGLDGWLEVVRSVSAFVGIAFAIRKLPWQSTLQLSLTLALANPAVWYLIDRSPPGFILSTIVALSGTAVLIGINPALIPPPSPAQLLHENTIRHGGIVNGSLEALKSEEHVLGIFSQESVGVATWIASVLFVSAVCFGNIGRRLVGKERVV